MWVVSHESDNDDVVADKEIILLTLEWVMSQKYMSRVTFLSKA